MEEGAAGMEGPEPHSLHRPEGEGTSVGGCSHDWRHRGDSEQWQLRNAWPPRLLPSADPNQSTGLGGPWRSLPPEDEV